MKKPSAPQRSSSVSSTGHILKRLADQRGATTAEYAVIIVAAVLAVMVTVFFLEGQAAKAFNHVGNTAAQFGKIE